MWKFIHKNDIDLAINLKNVKVYNNWTIKKVAQQEGVKYDKAKFLLSLLNLEDEIKLGIKLHLISSSHGKQLLRIKNNKKLRLSFYFFILKTKIKYRELKTLINSLLEDEKNKNT